MPTLARACLWTSRFSMPTAAVGMARSQSWDANTTRHYGTKQTRAIRRHGRIALVNLRLNTAEPSLDAELIEQALVALVLQRRQHLQVQARGPGLLQHLLRLLQVIRLG